MIKVYGVPRSRALRALWMCEELGLEYENVKTNFATGDTRKPEFLRINPNGHIPALQDGSLTLWESMAINLYLARKYDKGLWPESVDDEVGPMPSVCASGAGVKTGPVQRGAPVSASKACTAPSAPPT